MKHFNLKHIGIIAKYHMRFSLRNGSGMVFLLLTLIAALLVATAFIAPLEHVAKEAEADVTAGEMIKQASDSEFVNTAVGWLAGDRAQGEFLMREKPALLSCIMVVMLMLLPYLVCFGAFNQFSSDIANRGLRYVLLRTERVNIYFGRFLGTMLFSLITVVLCLVFLILYIQFKLGIYDGIELWLWGLQGVFAFFFICLPFTALCSWISGMINSAFGSLVLCLIIVVFPTLVLWVLNIYFEQDFLHQLWPTGWKFGILNNHFGTMVLSASVLSGFAILFLWIGLKCFEKRDL